MLLVAHHSVVTQAGSSNRTRKNIELLSPALQAPPLHSSFYPNSMMHVKA